jgi:hypothetical protein
MELAGRPHPAEHAQSARPLDDGIGVDTIAHRGAHRALASRGGHGPILTPGTILIAL